MLCKYCTLRCGVPAIINPRILYSMGCSWVVYHIQCAIYIYYTNKFWNSLRNLHRACYLVNQCTQSTNDDNQTACQGAPQLFLWMSSISWPVLKWWLDNDNFPVMIPTFYDHGSTWSSLLWRSSYFIDWKTWAILAMPTSFFVINKISLILTGRERRANIVAVP